MAITRLPDVGLFLLAAINQKIRQTVRFSQFLRVRQSTLY